jgi:hypothetical protein
LTGFFAAAREGVVERARADGGARHGVNVEGVGVRVVGRARNREARPRREGRENDMAAVVVVVVDVVGGCGGLAPGQVELGVCGWPFVN